MTDRPTPTPRPEPSDRQPFDVRAQIPESPDTPIDPRTLEVEAREQRTGSVISEILDWVKYILLALVLGLLITQFVAQRNEVVGSSMLPTLHDGDQLIVEKVSHRFGGLSPGDIITISGSRLGDPELEDQDIVKRIIAVGGQTVEIRDDMRVYVDGTPLEETYLSVGTATSPTGFGYDRVTVPEDELYVLGDNRGASVDSRYFGTVPESAVIGEVWVRVYPFNLFGTVD